MTVSTITSKFQTTVPREIRRRLHLVRNAVLEWKLEGGRAIVTPKSSRLLEFSGIVKVGAGSIRADIRSARRKRAKELAGSDGR